LQTRCKVWCLADDATFLRFTRSNQVTDNNETSPNADTRLENHTGLQRSNRSDQPQPCAHRAFRVVLMRLWIPKIHQHAIAHVLRNEASEATHGFCNTLLVGRNDLAQVFRVHARRECR
jgi:hypothetical protein